MCFRKAALKREWGEGSRADVTGGCDGDGGGEKGHATVFYL